MYKVGKHNLETYLHCQVHSGSECSQPNIWQQKGFFNTRLCGYRLKLITLYPQTKNARLLPVCLCGVVFRQRGSFIKNIHNILGRRQLLSTLSPLNLQHTNKLPVCESYILKPEILGSIVCKSNSCDCFYFVQWPTNAQLIDKLLHYYMFWHYRVILREPVVTTLPSYTSMSNAVVGNTI
jgi:hypothetical protein